MLFNCCGKGELLLFNSFHSGLGFGFFFLATPNELWDLSFPLLGIELRLSAERAKSTNQWTPREFPQIVSILT